MDSFPPPLLYIGECKCAFHYLSSYCKNMYFTLSFFSNACYYLGVHLNSHLTAYHFHMLEHILKCLLKEPVLNTNSIHPSTGLLINHHSHKKLFPLTVQWHTHTQSKGQKKDAWIPWNLVKCNRRLLAISRYDFVKFRTCKQNYRAFNDKSFK